MTIAKQIDIRDNIKKYFDMAFHGETIIVPRKENKNIVVRLFALKFSEKTFKMPLKFFSGIVDIVSVRTKHLSTRGVGDILGGRSSNPRWTGCRRLTN